MRNRLVNQFSDCAVNGDGHVQLPLLPDACWLRGKARGLLMTFAGAPKPVGRRGAGISRPSVKNAILAEGRRKAIVEAAVGVFYKKGYHVSRIIDVAKAAGVSHGTIYNYVRCKEDLLYLVCDEHFRGHEDIVSRAIAQAKTPEQTLDALLQANIEVINKYRRHFVVMLRELHHVSPAKRRAFFALAAEQRKYVQKVLLGVSKDTPLLIEDPVITANILVYLPKLIVSRGWDMRGVIDEEAINSAVFNFMRRGLGLSVQSGLRRQKVR
jgi:AcrR family transcriptional regulator